MNRRRFLAATIAAPLVLRTAPAAAGGWASIRLTEPLSPVIAGEPFELAFTINGHDMDDAFQTGLPISITFRHRETEETTRFEWPATRTDDPLYTIEMTLDEPGAYKWAITADPYPSLPMPTLHVLEPGSDPDGSLETQKQGKVTAEVMIDAQLYTPVRVTINAGEAVTWMNKDEMTHQVAWQSLDLDDSPLIKPGESHTVTFATAGKYPYYCGPHPWMTGSVVVE